MSAKRDRRAIEIFEQIVDLTAEERTAALEAACGTDAALRAAVERRLRADLEASRFLEQPVGGSPEAEAGAEPSPKPERLGPYRVLEEIGRGGMGVVYAAERDDDAFRRRVAIKVITSPNAPAEVARRLRAERRILALLEHPGIARIYDGGAAADGTPYLVMELIDGVPIDRYCARHGLSIEQRVSLVAKVCDAVEYAHRKLVVHRDLKPSNILVTPEGEPKLLDFGIAKVLDPDADPDGPEGDITAPWARPLTVNYASPEQIRGEAISTSSDVYSLGVVLYLLLTGALPRALAGHSPRQVERSLRDREPPRPSTAAARSDGSETAPPGAPARIARRLRRDLDAIAMKALRSDPETRYGSADQLGRDLGLFLRGFPVGARRGTLHYRLGKLLRRHRLAATATAAAIVLGVTALVSLAALATTQARNHDRLEAERGKLEQTLDFFLGLFEDAGPYVAEEVEVPLLYAVDRQAERLEGALRGQPDVRAAVLSTLGRVYLDLGEIERARDLQRQALALRREVFGDETVEIAESLDGLGAALRDAFEWEEADVRSAEAVALFRRRGETDSRRFLRSLNNRIELLCMLQDWEAADPLSAEALALARRAFEEEEPELSFAVAHRALVLSFRGDPEGSAMHYREALALFERRFGPDHVVFAPVLTNLGQLAARDERFEQAVAYWRRAEALYASAFGDAHYERVPPLSSLGRALHAMGDVAGAEAAYRQAMDVALRAPALEAEHMPRFYGRPATGLGALLEEAGRCAEVPSLFEGHIDAWASRPDHPVVRDAQALLARCAAAGEAAGAGP